MAALIIGIILILFCVFACLPMGLAWGAAVVAFLKGCAPVLAAFIGLVSVFIGIADIKDKREAMAEAEEEEAMKSEEGK